MIRIALFADIHGKFLLPFKMVEHYQNTTGNKIDWIIQCGDMGAFPTKATMDKATLRHVKNDRDELGFMDNFCQKNAEIEAFLNKLDINMLCVRGNHEDHEFLDNLEQQNPNQAYFPIDCYKRVFVAKTGHLINLPNKQGSEIISMLGIGRIGDRKNRPHAQYIQDYERQKLKQFYKEHSECDLLITHDKEVDSERGYGAEEIEQALDKVAFCYMFHGHTGEPYNQRTANNGITEIIKIKELEFNKHGKLEDGCMLILEKIALEKTDDTFNLSKVPLNEIIGFIKNTWHYL